MQRSDHQVSRTHKIEREQVCRYAWIEPEYGKGREIQRVSRPSEWPIRAHVVSVKGWSLRFGLRCDVRRTRQKGHERSNAEDLRELHFVCCCNRPEEPRGL